MPRPGSKLWIVVAVLVFAGVAGAALWSGWSHRNSPYLGPPPITLRQVIRSHGGAPGSQPPL